MCVCEVSLGPGAHLDYLRSSHHPRRRRHTCHTTGGAGLSAEVSVQPCANVEYDRGSAIGKTEPQSVPPRVKALSGRVEVVAEVMKTVGCWEFWAQL